MTAIYRFSRIFFTLRSLRLSQLYWLVVRRVLPTRQIRSSRYEGYDHGCIFSQHPSLSKLHSDGEYVFQFLNRTYSMPTENIDWHPASESRLWRYNLHYFDFLQDEGRSRKSVTILISSWIEANPVGTETAWEPYTLSLRIVNWIKCFSYFEGEIPKEWLISLHLQCRWLETNLEHHILANHLFKNIKALLVAGQFFDGQEAQCWYQTGLDLLKIELDEQCLDDGGHFERSPMYHSIFLEDLLDLINVSQASRHDVPPLDLLALKAISALRFLNGIMMPDRQIPLFNDSAFGVALTPDEIFTYAASLGLSWELDSEESGIRCSSYEDSGYYVIRDKQDMLIVDCGDIGPAYQPGHTHCDMLSYELCIDGERVVVDSGTYDYEPGAKRTYSRSTMAHNTVQVDTAEQSEVWSVFRVARRAKVKSAELVLYSSCVSEFSGEIECFPALAGGVTHRRCIKYSQQDGWFVKDQIDGAGSHVVCSFIHFHPAFRLVAVESGIEIYAENHRHVANVLVDSGIATEILDTQYFPQFGVLKNNQTLKLQVHDELPIMLVYQIKKVT